MPVEKNIPDYPTSTLLIEDIPADPAPAVLPRTEGDAASAQQHDERIVVNVSASLADEHFVLPHHRGKTASITLIGGLYQMDQASEMLSTFSVWSGTEERSVDLLYLPPLTARQRLFLDGLTALTQSISPDAAETSEIEQLAMRLPREASSAASTTLEALAEFMADHDVSSLLAAMRQVASPGYYEVDSSRCFIDKPVHRSQVHYLKLRDLPKVGLVK